jgi:hypothetical protein
MAIIQTLTTTFKAELLCAVHNFRQPGGNVFKLALYTSLAALDANTFQYVPAGEVVGTNYVAGGLPLANLGVTTAPGTPNSGGGFLDFADLTFPNVTLTARGALIYNSAPSSNVGPGGIALVNPAVCVLDFGADKTATAGDFTIIFPNPTAATAIIRIT